MKHKIISSSIKKIDTPLRSSQQVNLHFSMDIEVWTTVAHGKIVCCQLGISCVVTNLVTAIPAIVPA